MLFICFVYLRPTTTSALLTSLANMAATIAKYALTSRTCTVCKRLHRSQFHTNSKLKNVVSTDCISTLPRLEITVIEIVSGGSSLSCTSWHSQRPNTVIQNAVLPQHQTRTSFTLIEVSASRTSGLCVIIFQ